MRLTRSWLAKESKRALVRGLRPASRGLRPGAVMMVHPGRCGSTVLGNMLNRHPRIRWESELFTNATRCVDGHEELVPPDPAQLIRRRMDYGLWRWFGFEVKSHPLQNLAVVGWSEDRLLEEVLDQGVTHFILLERRNLLRRTVSALAAQSSGQYHRKAGEPERREKIRLDPAAIAFRGHTFSLVALFDEWIACHRAWAARLQVLPLLRLTYEEHIACDPSIGYRQVCSFLHLQPNQVRPNIRRTNARPLEQIVENWSEVENALVGTSYEWMLEANAQERSG